MKSIILAMLISFSTVLLGKEIDLPVNYWISLSEKEKISFINGAYGAITLLKSHHKLEVKKQYLHDENWIEPYYITRFYNISDEYWSNTVDYDLKIISLHIDALYSNSDNHMMPVFEALRVVSLIQDGERKKANLRLLQAQRKYSK